MACQAVLSHCQRMRNRWRRTREQTIPLFTRGGHRLEVILREYVIFLLEHVTLIKRPVITDGQTILDVGFSPESLDDYI